MQPMKLVVHYVVTRGAIVTFMCRDPGNGEESAVHVDTRPWAPVWREMRMFGLQRQEYAADGLELELDVCPTGEEAVGGER